MYLALHNLLECVGDHDKIMHHMNIRRLCALMLLCFNNEGAPIWVVSNCNNCTECTLKEVLLFLFHVKKKYMIIIIIIMIILVIIWLYDFDDDDNGSNLINNLMLISNLI